MKSILKKLGLVSCTLGFSQIILAAESLEDLSTQLELLQEKIAVLEAERSINAEAREWRYADSVVHLSGYADVNFVDTDGGDGEFTVGNFAPIFHYRYQDKLLSLIHI